LTLFFSTKIAGTATEVKSDVLHPNGNVFDQILLDGSAASFIANADLKQISRLSFIDLNDDIVQVELAGRGTVSIVLDDSSGPARPVNYDQSINYMKGHAGIVIAGADASTSLSIFSVGRANAVDQSFFRDGTNYDGFADIAYVAILSLDGKFGGLRLADTSFFATRGYTGIYAPYVQFTGPVYVGDIDAHDDAAPMFILKSASDIRITGGDLLQSNGRAVQVSGVTQLQFTDGQKSSGALLPAQPNRARLEENGTDVTAQIVSAPAP
jgi:hypothetical protein